jgi:signal recognition particle GTPase
MFETLTDRLNETFARLGRKGRLTEQDVDDAMREVRRALLEADVNFNRMSCIRSPRRRQSSVSRTRS